MVLISTLSFISSRPSWPEALSNEIYGWLIFTFEMAEEASFSLVTGSHFDIAADIERRITLD